MNGMKIQYPFQGNGAMQRIQQWIGDLFYESRFVLNATVYYINVVNRILTSLRLFNEIIIHVKVYLTMPLCKNTTVIPKQQEIKTLEGQKRLFS